MVKWINDFKSSQISSYKQENPKKRQFWLK